MTPLGDSAAPESEQDDSTYENTKFSAETQKEVTAAMSHTKHRLQGQEMTRLAPSMSRTHVLTWLFYEKLKNVSCEYDRWVVETQLCKLRDTSDTRWARFRDFFMESE